MDEDSTGLAAGVSDAASAQDLEMEHASLIRKNLEAL